MPSPPAIIVLAAGESSRMGRLKQLLVHEGRTLVRRAVESAIGAGEGPVVVVLGAHETSVREELAGLPVTLVTNAAWSEGMASSIRAGVQAVPEASAVVLMLCDQPLLTTSTLKALVDKQRESGRRIVACEYGGSLGVPALFDRSLFAELLALHGSHGAKKILEARRAEVGTVPFDGGDVDVDTPEQYARLVGGAR